MKSYDEIKPISYNDDPSDEFLMRLAGLAKNTECPPDKWFLVSQLSQFTTDDAAFIAACDPQVIASIARELLNRRALGR